jgi:hypothetical protein
MKQSEQDRVDYEKNKVVTRLLNHAGQTLITLNKINYELQSLEDEIENFDQKHLKDLWFSKCPYDQEVLKIRIEQKSELKKRYNSLKTDYDQNPLLQEVARIPSRGKRKDVLLGWLFYELTKIYTKKHNQNKTISTDWEKMLKVIKDNTQVSNALKTLSNAKEDKESKIKPNIFYEGQSIDYEKKRLRGRISDWKKFCEQENISKDIYPFNTPQHTYNILYTQK